MPCSFIWTNTSEHKGMPNRFESQESHTNDVKVKVGN